MPARAKAHPEDDAPNATFLHTETSPTAATVGNGVKYPDSGEMVYRVGLHGAVEPFIDVTASTGDSAALAALARYPQAKVTLVAPAPQDSKAA